MKKRILIIYETAGGGHYANARAIEKAVGLRYPDSEVHLMHVSQASGSKRITALYNSYNDLLKADPRLVRYGYRVMNAVNAERLVVPLVPRAYRKFEEYFLKVKPDIVVSVFGVFNYTTRRLLDDLGWSGQVPFVIFVTDLTRNFLKSWVHPDADLMIAMLPEAREQLLAYGMDPARIHVLDGLPVNPTFSTQQLDTETARRQLGLAVDRFTILVTMGGVANKNTVRFAAELAESGLPVQLVVCCGRNAGLKRQVEKLASRATIPIRVLGFTDQMPLLMDACDLAISKPGPGTIAELVHKERPFLLDGIFAPMPQEMGNVDFVVERGIGRVITPREGVVDWVRRLMDRPEELEAMRAAMRAIRNPEAVFDLVDRIMEAETSASRPS
ncbi:MAG: glycosyltransferase [bacterium]|nr:glycosyltransferase [bacterium]